MLPSDLASYWTALTIVEAIYVPLLAKDAEGRPLDYAQFAQRVEQLRAKYEPQGAASVSCFAFL